MSEQQIDLSRLDPPEVLDEPSYEDILEEMLGELRDKDPDLDLGPADPARKVLEVAAYRELLRRQDQNNRIRRLLLAYASGSDLDHIGVTYHATERRVTEEPDDDDDEDPVYEGDEEYRRRLLLAPDGYATAGPRRAYIYHALDADGDVLDADATSEVPGQVDVVVLSRQEPGEASDELLGKVEEALNAEEVRPLTDTVEVRSAHIKAYEVVAELEIRSGPDPDVVRERARDAVREYVERARRLGEDVLRDKVVAQLYVEGVDRVHLSMDGDVECDWDEAPHCEELTIT